MTTYELQYFDRIDKAWKAEINPSSGLPVQTKMQPQMLLASRQTRMSRDKWDKRHEYFRIVCVNDDGSKEPLDAA